MRLREQTKYFWLGIPVLFIAGSLFHFLYGLSGERLAIGLIAPVNESVFEHTKLFPLPAALWYGLIYRLQREKIAADPWFTAALLAIITQVSSMVLLYYFYTGAFGLSSLAVHITTFFVTVTLGQLVGLRYYKSGKGLDRRLSILLILAILVMFSIFTIVPPHLPIFLDPLTNTYGIAALLVSYTLR